MSARIDPSIASSSTQRGHRLYGSPGSGDPRAPVDRSTAQMFATCATRSQWEVILTSLEFGF